MGGSQCGPEVMIIGPVHIDTNVHTTDPSAYMKVRPAPRPFEVERQWLSTFKPSL